MEEPWIGLRPMTDGERERGREEGRVAVAAHAAHGREREGGRRAHETRIDRVQKIWWHSPTLLLVLKAIVVDGRQKQCDQVQRAATAAERHTTSQRIAYTWHTGGGRGMHFDMSDAQMVCVMGKTASLGLLSLSLSAVESKSKINCSSASERENVIAVPVHRNEEKGKYCKGEEMRKRSRLTKQGGFELPFLFCPLTITCNA